MGALFRREADPPPLPPPTPPLLSNISHQKTAHLLVLVVVKYSGVEASPTLVVLGPCVRRLDSLCQVSAQGSNACWVNTS